MLRLVLVCGGVGVSDHARGWCWRVEVWEFQTMLRLVLVCGGVGGWMELPVKRSSESCLFWQFPPAK